MTEVFVEQPLASPGSAKKNLLQQWLYEAMNFRKIFNAFELVQLIKLTCTSCSYDGSVSLTVLLSLLFKIQVWCSRGSSTNTFVII